MTARARLVAPPFAVVVVASPFAVVVAPPFAVVVAPPFAVVVVASPFAVVVAPPFAVVGAVRYWLSTVDGGLALGTAFWVCCCFPPAGAGAFAAPGLAALRWSATGSSSSAASAR